MCKEPAGGEQEYLPDTGSSQNKVWLNCQSKPDKKTLLLVNLIPLWNSARKE